MSSIVDKVDVSLEDEPVLSPIFHPADSWHAENLTHFLAAVAYTVLFFGAGISLRVTEYSSIKTQARQNWYKQSTFFHSFVLNNTYKDPANMLLALWSLIIGVILVTAFLDVNTAESSKTARTFTVFIGFLSLAIDIVTGYVSPDMLHQYDFGLSLLMIIISVGISAFALAYGVKQTISAREIQENERLRSDHSHEYILLAEASPDKGHSIVGAILRFLGGLLFKTVLAFIITSFIALLFAKIQNHSVTYTLTRLWLAFIAVALELIPCMLDTFFMLAIGVGVHVNKKKRICYAPRSIGELAYHIFTAAYSWLLSIWFFAIVLNPTTLPFIAITFFIPILIVIWYLLPIWNSLLIPIHKWFLERLIKDDQRRIELIHYHIYTSVSSTYLSSELSVDTHREYLLHTLITTKKEDENTLWQEICYPDSRDTNEVPLLSLSTKDLQDILEINKTQQTNDINPDKTKRQQNITCLVDKINTNNPEFNCCDQNDCKIYLSAIFDDRQYLLTPLNSESKKDEKQQKVITHNFSNCKGKWQLILTLVKR